MEPRKFAIGNALLLPFSIVFLAVLVNFVAVATSRLVGGNQRLQLLRHLGYLEKEQIRDAKETPDTDRFQLHDLQLTMHIVNSVTGLWKVGERHTETSL